MSTIAHNPSCYQHNGETPVDVIVAQEKSQTQLIEELENDTNAQQPVLPILSLLISGLNKTISPAYFAFSAIVGVGVLSFMLGAVAIFIYFSTHPVIYKSNTLDNFELKRILTGESEITPSNPINSSQLRSAVLPDKPAKAATAKNNTALDNGLPIQPNMHVAKPAVQVAPSNQQAILPKLKIEPSLPSPKKVIQPNTGEGHSVTESQPKNKSNEEKTKVERDNPRSIKPQTPINEQNNNDTLCNQAMRSLHQCGSP